MSDIVNRLKDYLFQDKITNVPEIKYLQDSNLFLTINRGFTELYRKKPKNPIMFLSKWLSHESLSKELEDVYKENKIRREHLKHKYYLKERKNYILEKRQKEQIKQRNDDEESLITEIKTCKDFWLGFNHICERLKILTNATGCYFGIYDHDEFARAMAWVEKYCKPQEGHDYNEDRQLFPGTPMTSFNGKGKGKTRAEKDADWEFTVKNMMIIRDLMCGNPKLLEMGYKEEALGHDAIAGGVQGQRQWTDYKPNFDFPESLMCSSFDWNGIREPYILATENDALNGLSMLFGHLLTGRGVMFSDVRTYWSPEAVRRVTGETPDGIAAGGFIHLINSGAKAPWDMTQADVEACLGATNWMPADRDYFRGGGYSAHFVSRGGMPMTMMRLNLVDGLGPVLQIAEGWTAELPQRMHDMLDRRTDPTWPTTWFVPRLDASKDCFKDVYSVMNNWGANHGAIAYGHIGADLLTLSSILRIPVCMHNVPDDQVFRPAAWNAFGMDKEGADYRACANFGPLYK